MKEKTASWLTHLEGEAESDLAPVISLLSHLEQLSLKATPLQLIQLVITLGHTEKSTWTFEMENLALLYYLLAVLLLHCSYISEEMFLKIDASRAVCGI